LTVEITDPVVLSTIVQTAVLTLTLLIFAMSFRTQNKANKEAAYQKALDDFTDAFKMLVDKPELNKLQDEMARIASPDSNAAPRSPEDRAVRSYFLLLYTLFERTHLLYRKKWINEDTWGQWSAFLETVAKHPMFREVHQGSEGMYDKPFLDYVSNILNTQQKTG